MPAKFELIDVSEIHLRPNDVEDEEERESNDFGSSREENESTHFDGFDMNGNDSDDDSYSNRDDTQNVKKFDGSSSDEFQPKEDSSDEDFVVKRNSNRKRDSDIPPGERKRGRPRKDVKALRKGPRGQFKCPHCDKWFTRRYRIDVHIKIKHGHQCDKCEHR